MSGRVAAGGHGRSRTRPSSAVQETPWARRVLIGAALAFLAVFLVLPLGMVFGAAFAKGSAAYLTALRDPEALSAVRLTLLTVAIAVPLNTVFGIAAAWVIAKYDFWGKSALLSVIDLPFSVSPVISGLIFVLLFGAQGVLGPWLDARSIQIVFAVPGIVLATTFVTFPIVAREVLAVMEAQGNDEEEAALTLGASGLQILLRVTLPKIRWGAFYGVVLCNARAMGEFGAVSVVSGHVRGQTNTMPLHIEILYNEYNFVAAFSVASLLALMALITLLVRKSAEWAVALRRVKMARSSAEAASTKTSVRPGVVVL